MTPHETHADLLAEITALREHVASLHRRIGGLQAALAQANDQEAATNRILRVISRSPAEIRTVLDTVAESAARLCESFDADIWRRDGDRLVLVAHHGQIPAGPIGEFTLSLGRGTAGGRSVLDERTVQVADMQAEADEFPESTENARRMGFRTILSVPLMREGVVLGAIILRRTEVQLFSERQVALLQTFADQAVIAIENVRLFNETKEALERQTATSEILRVISSSPTDVQPVFDTIAASAGRLCGGVAAIVTRFDGEMIHLVAHHNPRPGIESVTARLYPRRPGRDTTVARAILECSIVHVPDAEKDADLAPDLARDVRAGSFLAVPMLRDGQPIGAISVSRVETGAFLASQIELLKTFADQAVIAIENVRLFTELQAKNQALTTAHAQVTEALEQQTATSEILRTIAHSQTDVQPVFDTIVQSAVRLLRGYSGTLTRVAGGQIELAAFTSTGADADAALRASYPRSLESEGFLVMAIRERVPLNVAEAQTDPRSPQIARTFARVRGFQSLAAVPLLRQDDAVGAIMVTRREPGGFTDDEIALLQTFAAQAVIAIENVRLFNELQARTSELTRSVGELRALGEVGQAISSTLDLQTVLSTIVTRATQLSGTDAGVIYEYDEQREVFVPRATAHLEAEIVETMLAAPVRKGEGATGRLAEVQAPIQMPDILEAPTESRVRDVLVRAGYRALLAVPLVREDHLLGGLTVIRKATGEFAPEVIDLLRTFATQSALAIQNARLFREIAEKSRQLEVASQHKSEFLANMSHELRTPLNAIIGFSEVLTERMFGELNEKQEEYLKDIYASGTHLLSLINDILDLSKIEAGRMELELTDFHLPTALDNALTLVRERAGRRSIALQMSVDERLSEIRADERKIRQVVLNLLSNAIKFTPEGGRIELGAVPKDGLVEVSVSDTGVGIAPEDQEKVFEEFRQVGTAEKKAEGTGLGLTLCRKFIELHGGKIWVKSQEGVGSTFTFTIPVRHGE
jgi:two-component system, NtrC family, sensor kinase